MDTTVKATRRKIIDIPEDIFRYLSVKAAMCPPSSGVRLIILQRISLYAFADAPISADFRNRLRLAMILSGRAAVSKKLL